MYATDYNAEELAEIIVKNCGGDARKIREALELVENADVNPRSN